MRLHVPDESRALGESWTDIVQHGRPRESQAMAAVLCVKAACELLVRFFVGVLDLWRRSDVKLPLRADQEVTVTLVLREVKARRKQGTFLEGSPVDSHSTMGGMEEQTVFLGELLRTACNRDEDWRQIGYRSPIDQLDGTALLLDPLQVPCAS